MKDPTAPEIKPIVPKPVTINAEKSALLVLELSKQSENPEHFSYPLVPGLNRLLDKARAAGILIVFTIPPPLKGKPEGYVNADFKRRPCEAVIIPPSFDKFSDGQLQNLLIMHEINTLIITGCKANMAVLYTATRAVTEFNYNIVIPVDGIAATTEYEKEYTLYQFRAYPGGFPKNFTFTEYDMISFQ